MGSAFLVLVLSALAILAFTLVVTALSHHNLNREPDRPPPGRLLGPDDH